jgi:excisionase family DNA binding protein
VNLHGAPASEAEDRLLTTRQVATMFGVSPATVLRWWRAGRLPGFRVFSSNVLRFRLSELEAVLEEHRGGAQTPPRLRVVHQEE